MKKKFNKLDVLSEVKKRDLAKKQRKLQIKLQRQLKEKQLESEEENR
jgi:hypothetical protein